MTGQQIGYIRVSTVEQNTGRQLQGIDLDRVFKEKVSAKDRLRPQLQECIQYLREGDTLHVHSIDRLARNLVDLQQLVEDLTARSVTVQFHKEGLTFGEGNQDSPMQKLLFQMMGAVAEFERSLIRERQREGIAAAKKKGKILGRPGKLSSSQREEIRAKNLQGSTPTLLAREYNVSRGTVYNILAQ